MRVKGLTICTSLDSGFLFFTIPCQSLEFFILLFHENGDELVLYTQDGKFRETLQSDGEGSLEERSFTLVSGTTLVDVSYNHYTAPSCKIAEVILIYCFMGLNKVKPTKQLEAIMPNCCQWFWYTCTCMEFHFHWALALIYQCSGKKEHYVCSYWWSCSLPSPSSAFHCVSVWHMLVFSGEGCGCLWLGCQFLPAISAVSTSVLAVNSDAVVC